MIIKTFLAVFKNISLKSTFTVCALVRCQLAQSHMASGTPQVVYFPQFLRCPKKVSDLYGRALKCSNTLDLTELVTDFYSVIRKRAIIQNEVL